MYRTVLVTSRNGQFAHQETPGLLVPRVLAWAFLCGLGPQAAVDHGAAHGALAMTTPGDNASATLPEVRAVVEGRGAAAIR